MVDHAYLDSDRTQYISVLQALVEDHNIRYFCPNPRCDAYLYICQTDGNRNGYFAANRKLHRHIEYCPYSSGDATIAELYVEPEFDYKKAILKIETRVPYRPSRQTEDRRIGIQATSNISCRQPTTVRELYTLCKQHLPNEEFNNSKFGEILFDERSEDMHSSGPSGQMLVEAVKKPWFFENKGHKIFLKTATTHRYKLNIRVPDYRIYGQFKDTIFHNQDSKIVLAGTWTLGSDGTYSSLTINRKSQYLFLHHQKSTQERVRSQTAGFR